MPEVIGPAPEALSNEDIIREFKPELRKLTDNAIDAYYDQQRIVLINAARLNVEFVKGKHFLVPGSVDTPFGSMIDWQAFDPFSGSGASQQGGPQISVAPPIGIIAGLLFKFCAVMGANAPKVKAVPNDIHDSDSVHDATCADVSIREWWVKHKLDSIWKIVAFHQFTTGPVFVRTIWNTDGAKYGTSTEPKIEIVEGPDGLPMPSEAGTETYENGDAEPRIYSIFEVSVPYEAKTLPCEWLRCEVMASKWWLLKKYCGQNGKPGPLDQFREGDPPDDQLNASSTTAAEAREAAVSPTGIGRIKKPNYWRFHEYWIEPFYYEAIADKEKRQVLKEHYPDGIYIAMVGDVTCEVDNRKMTDEWAVCRVNRAENIMERPIASDIMPLQRTCDDLGGMSVETVLRAITRTIVDSQLIDREAMNTNEAVPGEFIQTALPVDGDIQKRIYQIPPARLSDQVIPLFDKFKELMEEISGVNPRIAGGGPPTATYRESKMLRDAALAQLAPQAQAMRDCSERVAENSTRLRAKYGSGTVKAQRKSAYGVQTDIIDIANLSSDNWHAESDDNFPMTLSDKRDAIYSIMKEFPPETQQALGTFDPMNIEETVELLQVPGFSSVQKEQFEKCLRDIEILLRESPIPGPVQSDGKPDEMEPSQPIDPYDDPKLCALVYGHWLIGNQKVKHQNPAGFANVVAKFMKYQAAALPPAPPPPPPLKGSLGIQLKAEDVPNLLPEILQGAGLPGNSPGQPQPPAVPPSSAPGVGAPAPAGAGQPPLASPLPPLPPGPAGPQGIQVQ
jgi:hypothetical protein